VPAPAELQRRLGNRGTTRLLAGATGEMPAGQRRAPVTPVRTTPAPLAAPAVIEPAPGPALATAAVAPPDLAAGAPPEFATEAGVPEAPSGAAPWLPGAGVAGPPPTEAPVAAPGAAPAPPAAEAPDSTLEAVTAPEVTGPGQEAVEAPAVPSAEEAVAPAVEAVAARARQQRAHSPAQAPVASASAAARQPAVEKQRSSAERTVEAIDAVPAGELPRQSFKEALRQAIDKTTPKPRTEDEADRVMSQGATDASAQLNAQLGVQREQAAGPLRSAAKAEAAPAPEAGLPAPELVREPQGPAPDPVSPDPVVPAPLPAERLDYSSDRSSTDQAMADAGVSTEQLQGGNEPEFAPALEARSTAEAHETSAAPQYRETETATRGESRAQATARLGGGFTGMRAQRLDLIGQVVGEQESTKAHQSQQRSLVTERVAAIKEATRHDVEVILTAMDAEAVAIFDVGLREAEEAYEDIFEEAKGGVGNWLTEWGSDWDELIEESLSAGRAAYLERVGRAIDEVATLVENRLAAAKQRVARGRAELDTFVAGLDEGLRAAGEEARQQVSAEFDALEASVDERRDRLVERLTQQYRDSYQRMSETENRLREENKSLWQRVYDATIGVIKKIIEFKNLLLEVLAQAASVIMLIIGDPIGFLSNLVQAVTLGVNNFKDHIVEHLQKGLLDWIFGAVARAGIELPATFDLKGILGLVLQILGLTWQNIRRIAVEMVGEPIVHALEMFAEPIIVLVREGPAGLWEWIKEKLTDLKAMLLDEIQGWLITNVIEAGITWVISLLNPASAFLKACKAIYDIVKFFVERARQLADFVKAVTESIGAIARGSLDGAAQRVEDALARAIPVAIGFLASLLGLDDLSDTIQQFIQKIRDPIEKAIRWLIGKAVDLVKAAGRLLGIGKEEGSKEGPEHDAKVAAGLAALKGAVEQRTGGESARSDAESIAGRVRADHPIFQQIDVVNADDSWRFNVVASNVKNKVELPKSGDGDQEVEAEAEWVEVRDEVLDVTPARIGRSTQAEAFESLGKDVALDMLVNRFEGKEFSRSATLPGGRGRGGGRSTLEELRLHAQMEMRKGAGPLGKRRPDYRTYVPVEGKSGETQDELHIFDPTLHPESYGTLPPRTEKKHIPETKAQQLFTTLASARAAAKEQAKNGGRSVRLIHYTVITDREPTKKTIKVIDEIRTSLNKQGPPEVKITWAVVEASK
jgi:hypothetical protein